MFSLRIESCDTTYYLNKNHTVKCDERLGQTMRGLTDGPFDQESRVWTVSFTGGATERDRPHMGGRAWAWWNWNHR
jgi:hypothetical protein